LLQDQSMVLVLDGGMSNALQDRGNDVSGPLWTAQVLLEAPQEVAAVHRAYYEAGAQVATTASYQATDPSLLARSVRVAQEVRDSLELPRRWVAASVGPYGAVLADGSEYRGRYGLSPQVLRDFHLPRLAALASAGPDYLAVETIPDVDEAEVLATLLDEVGLPAWFSYSIEGSRTRAGQPLEDAFAVAGSASCVFAVGVNCCSPYDVLDAVRLATSVTGLPAVAYPNSGEDWDASARTWRGGSAYDVGLVPAWVEAGAGYVGGCCRVGPEDIAALAELLEEEAAG
jgi:homocysteine S-methyltransferase